ncbi:MAG: carboxypeptidase regulatory-like domain-containing protein, partial [bacterium]|nr:carboxypeptidase regulatory-like domain-containing protein [bacterium]
RVRRILNHRVRPTARLSVLSIAALIVFAASFGTLHATTDTENPPLDSAVRNEEGLPVKVNELTGVTFDEEAAPEGKARLSIEGLVRGPDEQPLEGATAYVYTAKPREGTSSHCPSSYLDCGKRATTGTDGRFTIPELSPTLLFKILVVARGFEPSVVDNVDPGTGPILAALSALPPERLAPEHTAKGRVLDPLGHAVDGATVELYGYKTERGQCYGPVPGTDPLAITNENGEFMLTSEDPHITVFATVRARGLAPRKLHDLSAGPDVREIKLGYGVTVKGRLLEKGGLFRKGKPVAGSVIGIVQVSRDSESFLGEYTIGLNKDGYFELPNVAPNWDYHVYGKMGSLQGKGASPVRKFTAGKHGSEVDVGTLQIERGHRVAGRVVLSDGQSIPANTRLAFSHQGAWDSLFCGLDSEGRFA